MFFLHVSLVRLLHIEYKFTWQLCVLTNTNTRFFPFQQHNSCVKIELYENESGAFNVSPWIHSKDKSPKVLCEGRVRSPLTVACDLTDGCVWDYCTHSVCVVFF